MEKFIPIELKEFLKKQLHENPGLFKVEYPQDKILVVRIKPTMQNFEFSVVKRVNVSVGSKYEMYYSISYLPSSEQNVEAQFKNVDMVGIAECFDHWKALVLKDIELGSLLEDENDSFYTDLFSKIFREENNEVGNSPIDIEIGKEINSFLSQLKSTLEDRKKTYPKYLHAKIDELISEAQVVQDGIPEASKNTIFKKTRSILLKIGREVAWNVLVDIIKEFVMTDSVKFIKNMFNNIFTLSP